MIRPLVIYPDPRLRSKSLPVTRFGPELQPLASDMVDTMRHANGLGLAAIQIGVAERVMVMETGFDQDVKGEALVLLNPAVLEEEGSETVEEGCLSIPDVREDVERAFKIRVKGQLMDGTEKTFVFEGILARCVLHEIDHMNGVLFIQKVPAVKRLFLKKRLDSLKKEYEEASRL